MGTFEVHDLLTIVTLAGLEGVLSVDNALVLAILVRHLPPKQRKAALTWGIVGAFVFRLIAVIFATTLIQYESIKLVGGAYLLYLAIKHMFFGLIEEKSKTKDSVGSSLIKTIIAVELTDIVFSIDSITTAVAFSDKIWVLWFGGIMGIILLRFASGFFLKALEKFPKMEDLAYQLVFFVGSKLSLEALGVHIEVMIFWVMMVIIGVIGSSLIVKDAQLRKHSAKKSTEIISKLKGGEISVAEALEHQATKGEVLAYLYDTGYLGGSEIPKTK